MELVLVLQVVFLFLTFAFTLLSVLLPLKLVPRDPSREVANRSQRILSFCNCVGGGVFLATCFLQLVPYVYMKFFETLVDMPWDIHDVMFLTQCSIMLGFFMIVFIEQCVHKCQKHPADKDEENKQLLAMEKHPSEYRASSSDSTGSDNTDDGQQVLLDRKKKRKRKLSSRNGHVKSSSASDSHSHHHRHHLQHQHHRRHRHNSASLQPESEESHSGHDHGHSHEHGHSHLAGFAHDTLNIRCLLLLAALSLHSFFEGMAVGLQENITRLISLFIGIIVHEVLVSFALGVSLAKQQFRLKTLMPLAVAYSLMIPIGMAVGMGLENIHTFGGNLCSATIQGLTAGTFVYVIFLEILPPEINSTEDRLWKMLLLIVGFVVVGTLSYVLPQHGQ